MRRFARMSAVAAAGLLHAGLALWPGNASAGTMCESLLARFVAPNTGRPGLLGLERAARTGDCDAASKLARRALDAEGFAKIHCPIQVTEAAARAYRQGRDMLDIPKCVD